MSETHIDWKAVFAGAALSWTVLIGGGAVFHSNLLTAVDQRIAAHAEAAAGKRAEFFKELESRAESSIGRISTLEQHCASVRDWRTRVDTDLSGLHGWRERCGQRQEAFSAKLEFVGQRLEAIAAKLDRVEQQVNQR